MRYIRIILVVLIFLRFFIPVIKNWMWMKIGRTLQLFTGFLARMKIPHTLKSQRHFWSGWRNAICKIPDSSTYPDKLDVRLEEWSGSTMVKFFTLDTITRHNKQAGDSIFYYPDQLVYYWPTGTWIKTTPISLKLPQEDRSCGFCSTTLVHSFEIDIPDPYIKHVDFVPDIILKWNFTLHMEGSVISL